MRLFHGVPTRPSRHHSQAVAQVTHPPDWGGPADEQVKRWAWVSWEPELVVRTYFFARVNWQKSFFPNLVRKRVANGLRAGVIMC